MSPGARDTNYDLVLGSNLYQNCSGVIYVKGAEVFKLERGTNNSLLVSCEVRGQSNALLFKFVNNSIVFIDPNYQDEITFDNGQFKVLRVRESNTGNYILEVESLAENKMEINGMFWVRGVSYLATKKGATLAGGRTISNMTFANEGKGIVIK